MGVTTDNDQNLMVFYARLQIGISMLLEDQFGTKHQHE
jgi:hypothetical protein